MDQYDVTFKDGHVIRVSARNGDIAKENARAERLKELPPVERKDPKRKIASVSLLTDDDSKGAK